ncbi:hypothetical protein IT407_01435 [Candidatus Uhrbacteria bacterium]|nr:hypothetical protein [Candidatus Uhrbacteria bacterium]
MAMKRLVLLTSFAALLGAGCLNGTDPASVAFDPARPWSECPLAFGSASATHGLYALEFRSVTTTLEFSVDPSKSTVSYRFGSGRSAVQDRSCMEHGVFEKNYVDLPSLGLDEPTEIDSLSAEGSFLSQRFEVLMRVVPENPETRDRTRFRARVRIERALAGEESVRVPAGEFSSIRYNVTTTIELAPNRAQNGSQSVITSTEWWAPDLGRIKQSFAERSRLRSIELISFR